MLPDPVGPWVGNCSKGADVVDTTSRSVPLPTGSGGRVLVFLSGDGNNALAITEAGWLTLFAGLAAGGANYVRIAYKDEPAETSITVTSPSTAVAWVTQRVHNYDPLVPPAISSEVSG